MAGQGFASMSKPQRKETSAKGGRAARDRGTAHRWSREDSQSAANKGVVKRKANLAVRAAQRLIKIGFDADDLSALKLTVDEYIYFGGSRAKNHHWDELRERIAHGKSQGSVQTEAEGVQAGEGEALHEENS